MLDVLFVASRVEGWGVVGLRVDYVTRPYSGWRNVLVWAVPVFGWHQMAPPHEGRHHPPEKSRVRRGLFRFPAYTSQPGREWKKVNELPIVFGEKPEEAQPSAEFSLTSPHNLSRQVSSSHKELTSKERGIHSSQLDP
jgi:hypothetical protein